MLHILFLGNMAKASSTDIQEVQSVFPMVSPCRVYTLQKRELKNTSQLSDTISSYSV